MAATAKKRFDPYKVLGLDRGAKPDDVKRAYRRRAKETHPDHGGSREAFEKVSLANIVLADPAKRQRYDDTGEFDEAAPNVLDAQAMNLINSLMQAILTDDRDPFTTDLVKAMSDVFDKQIGEIGAKLRPIERAKGRAERMRDRFQRKTKGENQFRRMLDWHLQAINKAIAEHEDQIKQRRRAIEILKDYRFEHDAPPATTIVFTNLGGFANSSNSTSF